MVCLPHSYGEGGLKSIIINTKGQSTSTSCKVGVQGKLTITSVMSEESIRAAIRSAFKEVMGNDSSFPFTQVVGPSHSMCLLHFDGMHKKLVSWAKHVYTYWLEGSLMLKMSRCVKNVC